MCSSDLALALLRFQANAPHIALDATNPHFKNKYPSLAGIFDVLRPALSACGLVVTQTPTYLQDAAGNLVAGLRTRVTHAESGEFLEDTMLLLIEKATPQAQGSALTYARRYAVLSMLGLVGDEDDDGEAASKSAPVASRKAALSERELSGEAAGANTRPSRSESADSAEGRGERRVRIAPSLSGAVRPPRSRLIFAAGRFPDETVGQPPRLEETP